MERGVVDSLARKLPGHYLSHLEHLVNVSFLFLRVLYVFRASDMHYSTRTKQQRKRVKGMSSRDWCPVSAVPSTTLFGVVHLGIDK